MPQRRMSSAGSSSTRSRHLEKPDAPDHPGTRQGRLQPGLDEWHRRGEARASAGVHVHAGVAVGQDPWNDRQLFPRAQCMVSQWPRFVVEDKSPYHAPAATR
jgi:hypothetical protein